ncbi:hypothetical protein ACVWZL_009093 [Bradyrhizobium sp. GM2.4]
MTSSSPKFLCEHGGLIGFVALSPLTATAAPRVQSEPSSDSGEPTRVVGAILWAPIELATFPKLSYQQLIRGL